MSLDQGHFGEMGFFDCQYVTHCCVCLPVQVVTFECLDLETFNVVVHLDQG